MSVVIPCHNYGRFLPTAALSVTTQRGVDVDVLIIDDRSDDGSHLVAEALAAADPRISVVVHEQNRGHIATFNEGIEAAEGDYVVVLSADDLLAPGSLARATALLDAHPSVGLAYGDPVVFWGEPGPGAREGVDGWMIWEGRDWIERTCRSGRNQACSPEVVMRTSVQRQIGPYLAELPHSADMAMWLRAAAAADVGHIEGADQAFYRVHPDSLSRTLCVGPTDDLRARHGAFASVLGPPSSVPGADRLYERACRTLAVSALRSAFDILKRAHIGNLDPAPACDAADELEAFALFVFPQATRTPRRLRRPNARRLGRRPSALTTRGFRVRALMDGCAAGDGE